MFTAKLFSELPFLLGVHIVIIIRLFFYVWRALECAALLSAYLFKCRLW